MKINLPWHESVLGLIRKWFLSILNKAIRVNCWHNNPVMVEHTYYNDIANQVISNTNQVTFCQDHRLESDFYMD